MSATVEAHRPGVVVVATARPTFAVDVAADRAEQARALLADLGADVHGPAGLVMTPEDAAGAAEYLSGPCDLVVHVCASFADAAAARELYRGRPDPVLLWAFREPGPVGDRLWLNSLCGANLAGHAIVRDGGRVRLVHGDPDEPAVRQVLADALSGRLPAAVEAPEGPARPRAAAADVAARLEQLRGSRIAAVGDPPPGFTPSEYDPDLLARLLGILVEPLTLDEAFARIAAVTEPVVAAERAQAAAAQPSVRQLDAAVVARSAAVTSALREWADGADLDALAVRCWPEFPTQLDVCPCSSLSRLADEGRATACERDVLGAATMLLLAALGSGPTYLVDTVDLDAERGLVRLWHCGSAATALAADPSAARQSVHCNRRIGVAGDFALRTGPVVMARLTEDPRRGGLRLLLAAGESVPEPNRFQGNTAAVRLDSDPTAFVHGLVTGGFPHHTVLAWTDVRPRLRTAAEQLDIPVVEW